MKDNVVEFPGVVFNHARVDPEKVQKAAAEANLRTLLILGITEDGEFYAASSDGEGNDLLLMERYRYMLAKDW